MGTAEREQLGFWADTRTAPIADPINVNNHVVIGDVGGHLSFFTHILRQVGWNSNTGKLPPKITVVQVGDLVHKGPQSDACVTLANQLIKANPDTYIQLVGNHEAHYLGGPNVSERSGVKQISTTSVNTLQRWWDQKLMRVAYAIPNSIEYGPTLITHGGVTAGFFHDLGSPKTVCETANVLNAAADNTSFIFRPGALMTNIVDLSAGPICPRTGTELVDSWLDADTLPFSQIHGHESVWFWPNDTYHNDVPKRVRAVTSIDRFRRFCWATIDGRVLYSVDPTLGTTMPDGYSPTALTIRTL